MGSNLAGYESVVLESDNVSVVAFVETFLSEPGVAAFIQPPLESDQSEGVKVPGAYRMENRKGLLTGFFMIERWLPDCIGEQAHDRPVEAFGEKVLAMI